MKKVLYFDIWKKGYRNFLRLDSLFKKEGCETILLHTGSLRGEKGEYTEIKGLKAIDYSLFKTYSLKKIIKKIKPDVIIMLNLSFILDRAIVNICRQLGIKVIYLAHGNLPSYNSIDKAKKELNIQVWSRLSRLFQKKNFFGLINYIISLKGIKKIYSPFNLIKELIVNPSNYLTLANYDLELDADKMFVYTEADKKTLVKKFGYPEKKISVVGNPEISEFINNKILDREEVLKSLGLLEDDKYVLYLDDGYLDYIWDEHVWKEHFLDIHKMLKSLGINLCIKVHPRVGLERVKDVLNNSEIVLLKDIDFKNVIMQSEAVISIKSSTILYPLILNKKILSPRWGIIEAQEIKFPFSVVKYSYNKTEMMNYLVEKSEIDSKQRQSYLLSNGINLKKNSVKLIVDEVLRTI